MSLLRKYVLDPNHVLLELLKVARKGTLLREPEKILQVDAQRLHNRPFERNLIKWKIYLEGEAFGE